jgi:hypothetical protein
VNVASEPADRPAEAIDLAQIERALLRARKADGRPRCSKCGWGRSGSDAGLIRRRLCVSCEIRWIDHIVRRLIERVGRREAIRQLRALAPK